MAAETESQKRKQVEADVALQAEAKPQAKEGEQSAPSEPPAKKPCSGPADVKAEAKPEAHKGEQSAPSEPPAKKPRSGPPDVKAIKRQIEYYLSDENLRFDKFFHETISADKDGWLLLSLVLGCKKIQELGAGAEDIVRALKDSRVEVGKDGTAIRRPGNAKLPSLDNRPRYEKKNTVRAHDGGVLAVLSGVPEGSAWAELKVKLKAAIPDKAAISFVSEVSSEKQCVAALAPFEGDQALLNTLVIELGESKVTCEVAHGDKLQAALKLLPKRVHHQREKAARARAQERNRAILLNKIRFQNIGALKGRVKEIMKPLEDGEALKPETSGYKIVLELLKYHPNHEELSKGLKQIKVSPCGFSFTRCFWVVKESGEEVDVNMRCCLEAVELNPPLAPAPVTAKKPSDISAKAGAEAKKPGEAEAKKPAEDGATKPGEAEAKKQGEAEAKKPCEAEANSKAPEAEAKTEAKALQPEAKATEAKAAEESKPEATAIAKS